MYKKTIYSGRLTAGINQPFSTSNVRGYIRLFQQQMAGFSKQLQLWHQRRKQRRDLYALSDAMLKDIGVSRSDALQEADKPFWKP